MKSSRLVSAHCRSSNANTTGLVSASRSKNSRHAANRSSGSPMPSMWRGRSSDKDGIDHSRLGASHGFGPAILPRRLDHRLYAKMITDTAWMYAPMELIRL